MLEHGAIDVPAEDDEARTITAVQAWMSEQGLNRGVEDLALLSLDATREEAVLDLAWPEGLEHGEEKVAMLLNEPEEVKDAAGRHGYRYFTSVEEIKAYVRDVLLVTPA